MEIVGVLVVIPISMVLAAAFARLSARDVAELDGAKETPSA
jgi:hypothetical protein